jgi:hypothetical protein
MPPEGYKLPRLRERRQGASLQGRGDMRRFGGLKFIGGIGIAMALPAVVPFGGWQTNPLLGWYHHWFRLVREAGLAAAIALIASHLVRPQRPERVAMLIGGFVAWWALALPQLGQMPLPAGPYLGSLTRALDPDNTNDRTLILFGYISTRVLPVMVSCWIGANYWRARSWSDFWQGLGGAALKAGLVAGAIAAVVAEVVYFGSFVGIAVYSRLAEPLGHQFCSFPWFETWAYALSGIAWGAVVAAVLARWRPSPCRGALIGGGMMFAFSLLWLYIYLGSRYASLPSAMSLAALALAVTPMGRFLLHAVPPVIWALSVGAIAGSIAGRWRDAADGQATLAATADGGAC